MNGANISTAVSARQKPRSRLDITAISAGKNGTVTLTARIGSETLAVEKIDLAKSKSRHAFVAELCSGRPELEPEEIGRQLLEIAAESCNYAATDPQGHTEIDVNNVVRPELFFTNKVCGLAVPTMVGVGDKPAGRWRQYLRWTDGRREAVDLPPFLELPDDRLWLQPQPPAPTPTIVRGLGRWSAASRRRWLDGGGAVDPAAVFRRVCQQISEFVEFPKRSSTGDLAVISLWTVLGYLYPAWPAVPYLYFGGPVGSGKSRAFEVLARLVFRPRVSSNLTGPALFRTVHNYGGTLLFDEAERLQQTQRPEVGELLSLLLAGYKRGGQATRLEAVGDSFQTV